MYDIIMIVTRFITLDMERWSSWFMAPVLKIGVGVSLPWVRIPPSPPFFYIKYVNGAVPKRLKGAVC